MNDRDPYLSKDAEDYLNSVPNVLFAQVYEIVFKICKNSEVHTYLGDVTENGVAYRLYRHLEAHHRFIFHVEPNKTVFRKIKPY